MQKLILILIATLVAEIGVSQAVVPGKLLLLRGAQPPLPSCNGFYGIRCGDCTRLQVCMGGPSEVASYTCGELSLDTPYCNDRACSSIPASEECRKSTTVSSFQCTDAGLFPNTKNCSRYFFCPEAGDYARVVECPAQLIYDSKQEGCVPRDNNTFCSLINCRGGDFQVYPSDRSILAYCQPNAEYPILTRCPDKVNQEYDNVTLQCKTVCRAEGRFPDNLNCRKYYQCVRNGIDFLKVDGDCSPLSYDPFSRKCVARYNCQNAITTSTAFPIFGTATTVLN